VRKAGRKKVISILASMILLLLVWDIFSPDMFLSPHQKKERKKEKWQQK
jgi:hypothetical protein